MGLREFWNNAVRVLKLAKKPTWKEFKQMAKITGLGFIILGLVGYLFNLVVYLFTFR